MKKQINSSNPFGTRKIFKNVPHESKFNPMRKFYSFINIDSKDHYFEYIGQFRIEAVAHFKEQARLNNGKYTNLYTYQK